ncbi:hypothetical protein DKX38_007064 [Salix brachista]|uniref:NB-ARC domain-containing protein n=1 Tax=Salix brachista TaxID=2182728 RepID=A0A5N5MLX4_9ROSI|nr:hypothetical protein DKX38_007064 [Salix brachista]
MAMLCPKTQSFKPNERRLLHDLDVCALGSPDMDSGDSPTSGCNSLLVVCTLTIDGWRNSVIDNNLINTSLYIIEDRETDSLLDYSEIVGREDDVSIVTDKLTSLTKQHVLLVVPIVGMAGLGKTTVAKKVCEVVRERKHFDVTLWVCVSNNFNKVKILGAMLQMIDKTTGGLNSLDSILQNLKKELEKKSFFLVLDDVWNEDHGKWDDLKEQLLKISSKNGNAVVVTTRKTEIAAMMETSPGIQHKPEKLSDDECWSIIKQKVSGDGGATLAADLESIGKDIAKKCGGLPLLAKVLGGTLCRKETRELLRFWGRYVVIHDHVDQPVDCNGVLSTLLGFADVPPHNLQ